MGWLATLHTSCRVKLRSQIWKMILCAVEGCRSTRKHNPGLMFHVFPKNEDLQKKWIKLCRYSPGKNIRNARICSLHFDASDYKRHLKYELLNYYIPRTLQTLKEDAAPSKRLPPLKGKIFASECLCECV